MGLNVTDVQLDINIGLSIAITCVTIPGNFILLLIFYNYRNLRDQNNTAITMLSLTDFLRGCIVMTSKINNQSNHVTELNQVYCHVTAIVCAFSFVFCPLILALISFVRYCKIVPRGDKCWQFNNRVFYSLSCILFLTAVLFSVLPFIGVGDYAYSASHGVCFADWREINKAYRTIFYIIVIGIAFPVLTISYTMLYMALRKHDREFASKHCVDKTVSHQSKGASSFSTVATLSITIAEEGSSIEDNGDKTCANSQTPYKGIYEVDIDEKHFDANHEYEQVMEKYKSRKSSTPKYTGIYETDGDVDKDNGSTHTINNFSPRSLTPIPEQSDGCSELSTDGDSDESDVSNKEDNEKEIATENRIAVITKIKHHSTTPIPCNNKTQKDMKKVNKCFKKARQAPGFIKNLSKQECQVTKSLIFIFIAYVVCWFPAALVNVLSLNHAEHIPEIWYYIIVSMVELKSALDPVIYGLGNRRYQNALKCMVRQGRDRVGCAFEMVVCCYRR